MSHPSYTETEAHSRETFLALMWASSCPGRIHTLPQGPDSFGAIMNALLDLETSCYTPDNSLRPALAQTGAQLLAADRAAYHFYSSITDEALTTIQQARVGTMLYPDEAATLFVGHCTFGSGDRLLLRGPGIRGQREIQVSGVSPTFWELRASACHFPLGWDVFLLDGLNVLSIPRSVGVEWI